jgi:hypothetical protein
MSAAPAGAATMRAPQRRARYSATRDAIARRKSASRCAQKMRMAKMALQRCALIENARAESFHHFSAKI